MPEPPRISVFKPFFRRSPGEVAELEALYNEVASHQKKLQITPVEFGEKIYANFDYAPADLLTPLSWTLDALLKAEQVIFALPAANFGSMNVKELVGAKAFLQRKLYFFKNRDHVLQLVGETLENIFCALADMLPQTTDPSPFTIPLIYTLPDPRDFIERLYATVCDEVLSDRGLFADLRDRMYRNFCAASGIVPYEQTTRPPKFLAPSRSLLTLEEINDVYLGGTPFHALFRYPVPLAFTQQERFHHVHVLGGTGAGKTTLLQNLILHDLKLPDPPALVIVDSQGDLIRKISHLALFHPEYGALRDRFVLITPKDVRFPPALNVFDLNTERLDGYDEMTREQVMAGAIQTFDYLFSGLIGADLTAKQGVFFKYIARLMLSLPATMGRNATILDMMELMESPTNYRKAIEALPPIQRTFFERDFNNKTFAQTKEQIRYRLQAIIENPTIARLFTSQETRIDLFAELNQGSIILVDTAKDFLKGSSSHFGRIFISLVLQAILERASIPEHERRAAFLVVDEAAAYFDSNIDDLLTETRKYRLGCLFAHQYLDQAASSLKASLAANTSAKFAGGISMGDARAMAPEMRTSADFIQSQPRLHFACHIRNVTPQAVSIPIDVHAFGREPSMAEEDYARLIERNRARVAVLAPPPPAAEAPQPEAKETLHTQAERRFAAGHERSKGRSDTNPRPPKSEPPPAVPRDSDVSDEW